MVKFTPIPDDNDISAVVKSAFDTELALSGAWGYTKSQATVIEQNSQDIPLKQFEHTQASMRAYLEMSMTLNDEDRYGSINLNEISREEIPDAPYLYHCIEYEISAMKESDYTLFINAYKEGYGKEDFDMNAHFAQRKEKTIQRRVKHWFEVSSVK